MIIERIGLYPTDFHIEWIKRSAMRLSSNALHLANTSVIPRDRYSCYVHAIILYIVRNDLPRSAALLTKLCHDAASVCTMTILVTFTDVCVAAFMRWSCKNQLTPVHHWFQLISVSLWYWVRRRNMTFRHNKLGQSVEGGYCTSRQYAWHAFNKTSQNGPFGPKICCTNVRLLVRRVLPARSSVNESDYSFTSWKFS